MLGPLMFAQISGPFEDLGTQITWMSLIQMDGSVMEFQDVGTDEKPCYIRDMG